MGVDIGQCGSNRVQCLLGYSAGVEWIERVD